MTLQDQLVRDEGCRLKLYVDTRGKTSIGIGRNLTDDGISQAEAMLLLENDIEAATASLEKAFPWTMALDVVRLGALINMTFNMGIGGLAQFKNFLVAVQVGNWAEARNQMLDSEWVTQVGARAQRLAIQIETGVWQ